MSKSARIITLTVTAVLAVACFIGLWLVRPGEESAVLQSARERQNVPLVSVAEPLETDPVAVSAQEKFASEVREILLSDEDFIEDIKQLVLDDSAFVDSVSDKVLPVLRNEMNQVVAGYLRSYEPRIRQLIDESVSPVEATALVDEVIDPLTREVYADLVSDSSAIDTIAAEVAKRLSADGDFVSASRIRPVVSKVYNDNYDRLVSDVVAEVVRGLDIYAGAQISVPSTPVITEGSLKPVQTVTEEAAEVAAPVVVPVVVVPEAPEVVVETEVVAETVAAEPATETAEAVAEETVIEDTAVVIAEPVITEVAVEETAAEEVVTVVEEVVPVEEEVVVVEETAPVTEEIEVVEEAAVVAEEVAEEPAPILVPPAPEVSRIVVQAPSITGVSTVVTTEDDYAAVRKAAREAAIKAVLDSLSE